MKFLCRNCKAKYQIADEKVAGRTLRMTCQQCGEAIAVRGAGRAGAAVSRPLSQPMTPIAIGAQKVPSALGADFQRQVALPAPEAHAPRGADEWHVAINDVPVGPMRREEVARKIALGSVDREALAWREGMDDWMPAKHIPELALLFEPRPAVHSLMPPPTAAHTSQVPAPVQPAARVEMAPVGGRQMLSLDDYAPPVDIAAPTVTIAQLAPEPAAAQKPPGFAQMFALVCGGALILMIGIFFGVRVMGPQQQAPGPAAPVATAPTAQAAAHPAQHEDDQGEGRMIELDEQAIDGQSGSTTKRPTGATPAAVDKSKTGKQLTDEQKAMLERMGGGSTVGPNLQARAEKPTTSAGGGGSGQLTAQQLGGVVNRGRKNLQRCYEVALRGANSDQTVRLDVELDISPNGNVTRVNTSGKGLPGMDECITKTVKGWRFPSSGEVTSTRFPVLFQPGG